MRSEVRLTRQMKGIVRHVVIPAVLPALFFAVVATPVEVLGCRNRGLIALTISLIGGLASVGVMALGAVRRFRGDPTAALWVASALILIIPAVFIVVIAQ